MTKRQAVSLLTLLAVLYMAALVLLAPRLDLVGLSQIDSHIGWLAAAAAVGMVVASPPFLAIWAVHGQQRAAVRLPLISWLLAAFYLALLYGEMRYFGTGDAQFTLISIIVWLTAYMATVLPLGLLRAVRGWRLEWVGSGATRSADNKRQRQFTIRTLLGWTAAAAVLCAGLQWAAPYDAFELDDLSGDLLSDMTEGLFMGLIFALASLPVVSVVWLVLADGRRIILRAVLVAVTVLGIEAGIAAFWFWFDLRVREFVELAVAIEAGVLSTALPTALIVRACGYRLVRPSKKPPASAAGSSSNVPMRPRRFALACASLAAASVALACCAPGRLELWRQVDEKQAWATKGWDAGFDVNGRITRLARLDGHDPVMEAEFDIADLHDLESLVFSHSMLNDDGLLQYPIHNPAMARLASLDLADTLITDAGLAHLARFPNLTHLNLSGTNITDAGISRVVSLKHLTRLELAVTDVSDEAVESLSRLGQLESLDLQLTAVSEDGVQRLQEALPRATITYGASDAALEEILTGVRRGASIGIRMVRNYPKRLHARGGWRVVAPSTAVIRTAPALTDLGLAKVLGWRPALEELDLRESGVTDAGLKSLVKPMNLKRLDLRGAGVTESGCRKLAKTLTACDILR